MKSFLALGLLGAVLFLSVFSRSAPISGKENVFNYQVSIGKEAGTSFKQGFIIDTKVIVRRHADNTFNLQVSLVASETKIFTNKNVL
jgi:hypothetical protein